MTEEAAGPAPAAWVYPTDPDDGWEPGPPSARALAPSAIGGAAVPVAVYFLARPHVHGDAVALAIAGIPAAAWVAFEWVRKRTIDPIGVIVLFGFAAGLLASWALGGSAFVLKVRDSAFTALLACLALGSLAVCEKPLMFYIGRGISAGADANRQRLFDQLWDMPPSRAIFRILTVVWGVGLLCDATGRVVAAWILPTSVFVVVSPILSFTFLGGLFAFTFWFSRWARERAQEAMQLEVPDDGGSTWWWAAQFSPVRARGVASATSSNTA